MSVHQIDTKSLKYYIILHFSVCHPEHSEDSSRVQPNKIPRRAKALGRDDNKHQIKNAAPEGHRVFKI